MYFVIASVSEASNNLALIKCCFVSSLISKKQKEERNKRGETGEELDGSRGDGRVDVVREGEDTRPEVLDERDDTRGEFLVLEKADDGRDRGLATVSILVVKHPSKVLEVVAVQEDRIVQVHPLGQGVDADLADHWMHVSPSKLKDAIVFCVLIRKRESGRLVDVDDQ